MARTANRGTIQADSPCKKVIRWNLGEYVRLSKEDAQKERRGDDSNSVVNQCRLLDDYYTQNMDEFDGVERYIDDGCTGTDTNREAFQRLLADIHAKRINCVIVKDLSRLARNYTDAGSLIDNLFVMMNVRFISLQENIDSYKDPESVSNMIVPITNVFNENFCAVTSKKIRQVFDYKRRNGEFIGSFAPYGYDRDAKDRHALVVDEEAAEVVKQIFSMFLGGMSKLGIAHYLNDHGILSPAAYKVSKGLNYVVGNNSKNPMWTSATIGNMLKNRVYIGDMVQGRLRVKSYKIHVQERVPEEEWFIVENTHEPIIERKVFDGVQEILKRDTRTAPNKREVYLFSGFLKCADCGRAMSRIPRKGLYVYFQCGTYKSLSKKACTMHSIKNTKLEAAVLYAIRQQAYLAVSYTETINKINASPGKKNQSARLDETIAAKEKELVKIMRYKQSLYQDWKDGDITHNDYRHMAGDYERQAGAVQAVITTLKTERAEFAKGVDTENPFLAAFRKHENIDRLTREILTELIDHIRIHEGGDVSIRFKFADELRRMAEFIEVNTHSQTLKAAI